jgi:hypothetical protein
MNPIECSNYGAAAGYGGETGGYGTIPGYDDTPPFGYGGGGAGGYDGGVSNEGAGWGRSGVGADSFLLIVMIYSILTTT